MEKPIDSFGHCLEHGTLTEWTLTLKKYNLLKEYSQKNKERAQCWKPTHKDFCGFEPR